MVLLAGCGRTPDRTGCGIFLQPLGPDPKAADDLSEVRHQLACISPADHPLEQEKEIVREHQRLVNLQRSSGRAVRRPRSVLDPPQLGRKANAQARLISAILVVL